MSDLTPLFSFLIVVAILWVSTRDARKTAEKKPAVKTPAQAPAAPADPPVHGPGPNRPAPAPATMLPPRSGSMDVNSPEGVDPCHDHPTLLEGVDPCHDDLPRPAEFTPAAAEQPAETASSPLSGWTGKDVVRGFVWGEILNRKRS